MESNNKIRLPDNTLVKTALKYLIEETKRFQGEQRTVLKKMMEQNLNVYNLNWDLAVEMTKNREHWNTGISCFITVLLGFICMLNFEQSNNGCHFLLP